MWLKGTEEGAAAARVTSECVPAPTLLLLTVSECEGCFSFGWGENITVPDSVVGGYL